MKRQKERVCVVHVRWCKAKAKWGFLLSLEVLRVEIVTQEPRTLFKKLQGVSYNQFYPLSSFLLYFALFSYFELFYAVFLLFLALFNSFFLFGLSFWHFSALSYSFELFHALFNPFLSLFGSFFLFGLSFCSFELFLTPESSFLLFELFLFF